MEQDREKKIRSSKMILGIGTKKKFRTMGRSGYPRKSTEQLDKESKVSKEAMQTPQQRGEE